MSSESPPSDHPDSAANLADMTVRYDLVQMKQEVKDDFTAESSSHRLLRQADISKRFQRRRANRQTKNADDS